MDRELIIFAQLGSPRSPKIADVRRYLRDFLSNPLVVDLNPIFWKIILYLFILPFRPRKSAARYRKIWDGENFLLNKLSQQFVDKLQEREVDCKLGYILSEPSLKDLVEKNCDCKIKVVPLFPQYCKSTTGLVEEIIEGKEVELVSSFHNHPAYIASCIRKINVGLSSRSIERLIISFHSVPIEGNAIYIQQCLETFELIKAGLNLPDVRLGFQSKFGKGQWMGPFLEELLEEDDKKEIAIFCPGFLMDCLETTLEVGEELKEEALKKGINLHYIEALNDSDFWVEDIIKALIEGLNH